MSTNIDIADESTTGIIRDSFVFYRSYYNALLSFEPEQFKDIFIMIAEYALDGIIPEVEGIEHALFTLIKPQIDANNRKYLNGCKGKEYGKLGGKGIKSDVEPNPKRTPSEPQVNPKRTPTEPQANPKLTPTEPQANPKRTPNENDNDNLNKNVKGKCNMLYDDDDENTLASTTRTPADIIELFNLLCPSFSRYEHISEEDNINLNNSLTKYSENEFIALFQKAENSNFLKGDNERNWKASFSWLVKSDNIAKVLNGNYDQYFFKENDADNDNFYDILEKWASKDD